MSSTRKKLKRLFKKPTSTASEAFAPRELNRSPREFDEDGRLVDASLAQPESSTRTNSAAHRNAATSDRNSPPRPSITTHSRPASAIPPPPSKARGDEPAQPHAHHTAPWAAHAAFDSWRQQQGGNAAAKRPDTRPAQTDRGSLNTPSTQADTRSEQPSSAAARSQTSTSPPGHVHRVDAGTHSKRVGMQASREFLDWKKRRKQQSSREHGASQVTKSDSPQTRESPVRIDLSPLDTPASGARPSKKKELPKDRVRRRAIRSKEAFLPEHARQYELKDVAPAETALPPSKAGGGRDTQKPRASKRQALTAHASPAQNKQKLTMRTTAAPTAQTPAERLMWVSAHQHELSDEHIISTLSALEGAALRAGHEARRLRMLSESLLRLERNDDALEALHALQTIVPHDAWTLLRLAETCATRADMMEAGLRWCDDALRLHPWLSQAQTLRAEIEAQLQKFN